MQHRRAALLTSDGSLCHHPPSPKAACNKPFGPCCDQDLEEPQIDCVWDLPASDPAPTMLRHQFQSDSTRCTARKYPLSRQIATENHPVIGSVKDTPPLFPLGC